MLLAAVAMVAIATTTATAKPAKPAAGLKVGLVTDIAGLGDKSFNYLAGKGLKAAEKKYGIQGDVTVSKSNNDYVPNITKYALKGYDLVIAVGFLEEQAVAQVSKKFPKVKFAIIDDSTSVKALKGLKNVEGLLYKEWEVGLPRRLPRRPVREVRGAKGLNSAERHVDGRRHQDPAGRPLHRRLPGRREGGRSRRQAAQRLLRRLRRAGQVPGPRPAADRAGRGHHLPGRGPVRSRRHQRGARQGLLGHRRRHEPGAADRLQAAARLGRQGRRRLGRRRRRPGREPASSAAARTSLLGVNEKGAGIQGINSAVPAVDQGQGQRAHRQDEGGQGQHPDRRSSSRGGGIRLRHRVSRARAPTWRSSSAGSRSGSARSPPTMRSTSTCARARCTRCWARTARASRRS